MMYIFGNPAIFGFGIFCVFAALVIGIARKDKRAFLPLLAFAFQYLPWFGIARYVFIYHFFTAVPFLILCTVYVLNFMREELPALVQKVSGRKQARVITYKASEVFIYTYLVIVAVLLVLFYPAASGMVVDESYIRYIRWVNFS
jgi:dolichyl-phosphate-mannose--protein O-mannosyl transferase